MSWIEERNDPAERGELLCSDARTARCVVLEGTAAVEESMLCFQVEEGSESAARDEDRIFPSLHAASHFHRRHRRDYKYCFTNFAPSFADIQARN